MFVFGIPLSFFLPLIVHVWAGLATVIIGIVAFRAPKRRGRHPRWGVRYLWAYTLVFLTATILSAERWSTDAYLFFIALVGYGLALGGYAARRFRRERWVMRLLGKNWVIAHIIGTIGSYIVLLTGFYVDNAHLIPLLNRLPPLTFWVLPTVIGIPFIVLSLSRFAPKTVAPSSRLRTESHAVTKEEGYDTASFEEETV
jgi:multisubunit Na+/H+ antiporter MnhF subunit